MRERNIQKKYFKYNKLNNHDSEVTTFYPYPDQTRESVEVKKIPAGTGSGLSENAKSYMEERDQYRAEQAKAADEEAKRQEALRVERDKARDAEEQAAAQRATARAIWATGRR